MSERFTLPPRPPQHASASNVTLRADLIAANIFQRMAVGSRIGYTREKLAVRAFDDAAAFIAESRRRDPHTGELTHPVDGLPKEE